MFDKAFQSIKSIKLTGGVFGKMNTLLIVLIICVAAACITLDVWWVTLTLILIVLFLVFYTLKRSFDFADKNPQAAIMDGAELLVHEQMLQATKKGGAIEDDSPTIDHPQPSIKEIDSPDELSEEKGGKQ